MADRLVFGIRFYAVRDIDDVIEATTANKTEFAVVPLFHPRNRRDKHISATRRGPQTRSDRELSCKNWTSTIVGEISQWIDLNDTISSSNRSASEFAFKQEISWASHLSLQAVLCPYPGDSSCGNYARCILQTLPLSPYMQYWVRIPIVAPIYSILDGGIPTLKNAQCRDGWQSWNTLRMQVGHSHRLSAALELNDDLQSLLSSRGQGDERFDSVDDSNDFSINVIQKWRAEPVKVLIIPTSLFLTNAKGYPVLSKALQAVVNIFLPFKIHILFTGYPKHSTPDGVLSYAVYMQYLLFLHVRVREAMSPAELAFASYRDTLQSPLQPLMDNLEAQTYETFEKDSIKYVQYEAAIVEALQDVIRGRDSSYAELPSSSITEEDQQDANSPSNNHPVIVTVVGAGRGPLVAASLSASTTTGIPIRVFAVEKNENAVITLRNRIFTERWTNVKVISCDMRAWVPEELADIMVSELLGSWGDNELSPECLDGAQKCLKPVTGISIPVNYTSFVLPMSSAKLWMGARDIGETPQPYGTYSLGHKSLDSPYVVKFHNWFPLAAASVPLFKFEHPNPNSDIDNTRFATVSMVAEADATLHGFCGTFESVLYKSVMLSTMPSTHTPDMYSWFPLFIPLGNPVTVKKGDMITISIWRCVSASKIWYEWALMSPIICPIQNSGGKSYWIGI